MNQARAPRGGEEGIAPEVQGRHRQPADPRHTGRLKPSRFAAFSSVFGRRNAWGSMKMESVQTGWA
jgi:hypothetical protein